jgi:hypothetical protein
METNVAGDLGHVEALLERIAHAVEHLASLKGTFEPLKPTTALAPSSSESTAKANTEQASE